MDLGELLLGKFEVAAELLDDVLVALQLLAELVHFVLVHRK